MARIALISDVHLGTRQYGIQERYEDFLEAFRKFGNAMEEHRPDAVIIGGDLFDSPRPDAKSVFTAKEVVKRIKNAGIPVYGIDGNHDLADGYWLRTIGAEIFDHGVVDVVDIAGVKVGGINYRNGRDLVEEIGRMADSGLKMDALVAHFALAEMNGGGSADTGVRELSPLLDKLGVKYMLMGHVHIPDARKWNGVLYVNPGSTEMKSSNEPREKYWFMLDTDTHEATPMRLYTRPVEDVDIATEEDLLEFQGRLNADMVAGKEKLTFYQVVASDDIEEGFKRIAKSVHDASALARIVMRSGKSRDVAPVVDRAESVATLESAIEARFPKDSDEAKLISSMLHSPEPSAIHLIVDRFMKGEKPE